mmetsp:Transcript_80507/g.223999  ORF Transcript_80507/g.223999 Transcript_80507/m.223999 type:complete len:200 (-) Transcript_80507:929-1528(-)
MLEAGLHVGCCASYSRRRPAAALGPSFLPADGARGRAGAWERTCVGPGHVRGGRGKRQSPVQGRRLALGAGARVGAHATGGCHSRVPGWSRRALEMPSAVGRDLADAGVRGRAYGPSEAGSPHGRFVAVRRRRAPRKPSRRRAGVDAAGGRRWCYARYTPLVASPRGGGGHRRAASQTTQKRGGSCAAYGWHSIDVARH